jgi:hypothetical protein
MKAAKEWRTLTRDQRRAWNAWAKNNKVLLDDGNVRCVSGRKAMTMVLRNRTIAGEAANPSVVPAATNWLDGALSTREAGPWTVGVGHVGFRADQDIPAGTKWFVWATPPVEASEANPKPLLRFMKFMTLDAMAVDDITPNLGGDYEAVNGTWRGPGLVILDEDTGLPLVPEQRTTDGEWPTTHFVWFRLHQYANGQLSPGRVLRGWIGVEL